MINDFNFRGEAPGTFFYLGTGGKPVDNRLGFRIPGGATTFDPVNFSLCLFV